MSLDDTVAEALSDWVETQEAAGANVDVEQETDNARGYVSSGGDFGGVDQCFLCCAAVHQQGRTWQVAYGSYGEDPDPGRALRRPPCR